MDYLLRSRTYIRAAFLDCAVHVSIRIFVDPFVYCIVVPWSRLCVIRYYIGNNMRFVVCYTSVSSNCFGFDQDLGDGQCCGSMFLRRHKMLDLVEYMLFSRRLKKRS